MPQNENPTSQDQFDHLFDEQPQILNGVGLDQAKSKSVDPSQTTKPTTQYPLPKIWFKGSQGRCEINLSSVKELLVDKQWGLINDNELIRRNGSVLEIHDIKSLSKFIWKLYHLLPENDFEDPTKLGEVKKEIETELGGIEEVYFSKKEVEHALMKFGWMNEKQVIYLRDFYDDPKKMKHRDYVAEDYTPVLRDNDQEVSHFFHNGVVRITKNQIDLLPLSSVEGGYIWESKFKDQIDDIKIQKDFSFNGSKGVFKDFVEKCMSVKDDHGNWKLDQSEYTTFRTTYGYLLSNYTNYGDSPAPLFVDRETDGIHAEGGNGKSLIMGSVEHWKKTLSINGKNIDKKDKFLFSGVNHDTEFIFLDDVGDDFDFKVVYNYTTSDMEIEKKFKDRFVIPKDQKPKLGVATNYIMSDTDFSSTRRQYIVEFGSYWHDKTKFDGISVQEHYGKRLFDHGWTEQDWIDFYNFGFNCIKEYLLKGVVANNRSNYRKKQIVAKIEGFGNNDGVVDFIQDYIIDGKGFMNDNDKWGILLDDFYNDFVNQADDQVVEKWDQTRFHKAIWEICKDKMWEYNPHCKGTTMSQKRSLKGKRGSQKPYIKIGKVVSG